MMNRIRERITLTAGVILIFTGFITAQEIDPAIQKKYTFIDYENNELIFPGDKGNFNQFFSKLDTLILTGKGKINIVHFGGSHIQADIYTHEMRKKLQSMEPGLNGGRGLIFPFRVAKTNNPSNYRITYTGNWDYCKNIELKKTCNLGVTGIMVYTSDPDASLFVDPNADSTVHYDFNEIRIFHNPGYDSLYVQLPDTIIYGTWNKNYGCSVFHLSDYYDSFRLPVLPDSGSVFELYGIDLESNDDGIVYHSIGVNGSKLPSYIRCNLLEQQLAALEPDLIIISIGTNDAYTRYFHPDQYKLNYIHFLSMLKDAAPDAAILLTVPNDSYLYRRYINRNTAKVEKVILDLAKTNNYGVWDFYSIMGGLNSAQAWYAMRLMKYDRIHFNKEGYLLKGDLFYNAFFKSWESRFDNYYHYEKYIRFVNNQ
jgi:lysophospholipase L1-like esterase